MIEATGSQDEKSKANRICTTHNKQKAFFNKVVFIENHPIEKEFINNDIIPYKEHILRKKLNQKISNVCLYFILDVLVFFNSTYIMNINKNYWYQYQIIAISPLRYFHNIISIGQVHQKLTQNNRDKLFFLEIIM